MNLKKFFRRAGKLLILACIVSMITLFGVRYHGVTENTYKRFVVDAGAVYKNYGIPVRTVTLNTVIAGNKLVVNGITMTGVAASPVGTDFLIGVSDDATATNLAAVIDAMDSITAVAVAKVITITGLNGISLDVTTPNAPTMAITTNNNTNTLLGATRDGNTFTIETEYRQIALDGAKGPVKGGQDITAVVAKISAKFVEISTDLIKMALPGSAAADHPTVTPTHDEIRRTLQIALTDYITNVVMVGRVSGSGEPIVVGIENALALGGFELAEVDNDEAGITIELTAHFDPTNLDAEPWFIRWPQDV
jgi:hypothetical protein